MRRALAGMLLGWSLACGGFGETPEPAPPALPRGFRATVSPATVGLSDRVCDDGQGNGWRWTPDGHFEARTPTAKFAGDWRVDGADLIWVTTGPIAARCTDARWLSGDGVDALLCTEGPIGCRPANARPIELVDAGGGADAVRRVAERLAEHEPAAIAFQGPADGALDGLEIAWHGGGSLQRHAEALADAFSARMGPVRVVEDPGTGSPIVVRVGRL